MREHTFLFEYFSGKSHINVAVSPVLTDKFSKYSSDDIIDKDNNNKAQLMIKIETI